MRVRSRHINRKHVSATLNVNQTLTMTIGQWVAALKSPSLQVQLISTSDFSRIRYQSKIMKPPGELTNLFDVAVTVHLLTKTKVLLFFSITRHS
jgi:hypothetical protein